MQSKEISDFWKLFQKRKSNLEVINSADHLLYDELLEQLQKINSGLYFEFSLNPEGCELIITADGDRSLFSLVEYIVSAAPNISGWTIFSLKPKIGFPVTTRWENVNVAIKDVVFEPLEREGSGDLGLRIYVPGISGEETEDIHNAILRALDHGLGERKFADSIQYTEVLPLPPNFSCDDFIPITDIERYIAWRNNIINENGGQPAG
jgi:hypothetical protein